MNSCVAKTKWKSNESEKLKNDVFGVKARRRRRKNGGILGPKSEISPSFGDPPPWGWGVSPIISGNKRYVSTFLRELTPMLYDLRYFRNSADFRSRDHKIFRNNSGRALWVSTVLGGARCPLATTTRTLVTTHFFQTVFFNS